MRWSFGRTDELSLWLDARFAPGVFVLLFAAAVACGGDDDGGGEPLLVAEQADSDECEEGGKVVTVGTDRSGSGTLSDEEITEQVVICDGTDGSEGPQGEEGPEGESADCADVEPPELDVALEEATYYRAGETYSVEVNSSAESLDVELLGDVQVGEVSTGEEATTAEVTFLRQEPSRVLVVATDGCHLVAESVQIEEVYPPPYEMIDGGGFHTCGLRVDGTIDCWGVEEIPLEDDDVEQIDPEAIADTPDDDDFVDVAVDTMVACGIHEDGRVSCWGGWLLEDQQVDVTLDVDAATVNPSPFGVCGATNDGGAYCWDDEGLDVGDDPEEMFDIDEPDADIVDIGLVLRLFGTTAGMVQLGSGEVYLLNGDLLLEGESFVAIDPAFAAFCGITASERLQCIFVAVEPGDDDDDELTLDFESADTGAEVLNTGHGHGCAVFDDGSIDCVGEVIEEWVEQEDADLLDETALDAPDGDHFVDVAAGGLHSCALTDEREVVCWGDVRTDIGEFPEVTEPIQ